MSVEELRAHWPGAKGIYIFPDIFEPKVVETISGGFFRENRGKFNEVKDALCDEFSQKSMDAFLNEKVSGDYRLLPPYVVNPQYFFGNAPWEYSDHEILLDCGAFDGDSIRDFINTVDSYNSIIACEPDKINYGKLVSNIEKNNWNKVTPYMIGLSDEAATLMFQSSGTTMSKIEQTGEEKIAVDTIDHLLNGQPVSVIKMDIEGFELAALRGAENTIKTYRPMLMISAYHKKDDIYNIFHFINSRVERYHYYFRCHRPWPIDAVLYAIPEEKAH